MKTDSREGAKSQRLVKVEIYFPGHWRGGRCIWWVWRRCGFKSARDWLLASFLNDLVDFLETHPKLSGILGLLQQLLR